MPAGLISWVAQAPCACAELAMPVKLLARCGSYTPARNDTSSRSICMKLCYTLNAVQKDKRVSLRLKMHANPGRKAQCVMVDNVIAE
jgi:hypothetical protein